MKTSELIERLKKERNQYKSLYSLAKRYLEIFNDAGSQVAKEGLERLSKDQSRYSKIRRKLNKL